MTTKGKTPEDVVRQIVVSHELLREQLDNLNIAIGRAMQDVRRIDYDGPRIALHTKVEDAMRPLVDAVVQASLDELRRARKLSPAAIERLLED